MTTNTWRGRPTTRRLIIRCNQLGLSHYKTDFYRSYRTPIFHVAYNLGARGIDLDEQPSVVAWRESIAPKTGLSINYRNYEPEYGLSVSYINLELKLKYDQTMKWLMKRPRHEYKGLLMPFRNKDGDYLILAYGFEVLDD